MTWGWLFLAGTVLTYGIANFLQAIAATRLSERPTLTPALFLHLATYKSYVFGLLFQLIASLLAFAARRDLPLFLVQAVIASGVAVTALLGVFLLKWQLPKTEIALLLLLVVGITGLVVSAEPSKAHKLGPIALLGLGGLLLVLAIAGRLTVRVKGTPGSVLMGALAGVAFGAAAVASRPLAAVHSWTEFAMSPLLYLMAAHTAVALLLFGSALQRGATNAAVASMEAATVVPAAVIGLTLLGDRITPGMEWLAGIGFVLTIIAVLGLARYSEQQHHDFDERFEQIGLHKLVRS